MAGIARFLPRWAPIRFDHLVPQAGSPGSPRVPATDAFLGRLAWKLRDKERRSPISDVNCDEALGRFAGRNIRPKTAFTAESSSRTQPDPQERLLAGGIAARAPRLVPDRDAFSLDFHALPARGDPTARDTPSLPRQSQAGPRGLSFFAQEPESRGLGDANANPTGADQSGELRRFVAFGHQITGHDPQGLYFDSQVVPSAERSRVNQRAIPFDTIRRRGTAVLPRLQAVPLQAWPRAVIAPPKRGHQRIRFVDEAIRLTGYEGTIRQRAVDGRGREQPTLFLTHEFGATARALIIRYAGRNRVQGGLGTSINFFHLDCLASEVRLKVDRDVAWTVLANGCYRGLANRLQGFDRSDPKQVYRKCVETAGAGKIPSDRIVVRFDRRCQNPILRAAAWDRHCPPIPWLDNRPLAFMRHLIGSL